MNIDGRLRKIKLRMTPRRVAVRYLDWAHSFPRTTKEHCPLPNLFKQMETEIDFRSTFLHAKQEVCFLVELYFRALTELIDNASASLHLNLFVEAYCIPRPVSCPGLHGRLVEHCNALSVSLAAIEQIQTDYLHTPVMSGELRDLLIDIPIYSQSLSLRLLGPRAVLREGESGISERFLEGHEVAEQARGEVRELVHLARETASRISCERAGFILIGRLFAFRKHCSDFKLCVDLADEKAKQELECMAIAGGNRSGASGVRGPGKAVHRKRTQTD
jgi:hypothetical protein